MHEPYRLFDSLGSASRWKTLRAVRVLGWYNNLTAVSLVAGLESGSARTLNQYFSWSI